jgi:hypothetical protein
MKQSPAYTRAQRQFIDELAEKVWLDRLNRFHQLTGRMFWQDLGHLAISHGLPPPSFGQARYLLSKLRRTAGRPDPYAALAAYTYRKRLQSLSRKVPSIIARPGAHPHPQCGHVTQIDKTACPPLLACDECRQEGTCRRIQYCVRYRCAFGAARKP